MKKSLIENFFFFFCSALSKTTLCTQNLYLKPLSNLRFFKYNVTPSKEKKTRRTCCLLYVILLHYKETIPSNYQVINNERHTSLDKFAYFKSIFLTADVSDTGAYSGPSTNIYEGVFL